MIRIIIFCGSLLLSGFIYAKSFNLYLYIPSGSTASTSFFERNIFYTRCDVQIGEDEETRFPANSFINVTSSEFKKIYCEFPGRDTTYEFKYGRDVINPDFWAGTNIKNSEFGLLFDGTGNPFRFDSPHVYSESSPYYGWWDTPVSGSFGFSTHSYWGPYINDAWQIPAAILLKPAKIRGTERSRGYITSASYIPEGAEAALLNGRFYFYEQNYRDDNSKIIKPLRLSGYYSFDEKLSPVKVRVTQAVFQEGDDPIRLVHMRTTAVIVDKTENLSNKQATVKILDITTGTENPPIIFQTTEVNAKPGENPLQKIFYCNESNKFCNLNKDKKYEILIGFGDGFSEISKTVTVKETNMLELFFVPIITPDRIQESILRDKPFIELYVANANRFIQQVYPLSDKGLTLVSKYSDVRHPESVKDPIKGSETYCDYKSWFFDRSADVFICDISKVDRLKNKTKSVFQRGIGLVNPFYFENLGLGNVTGIRNKNYKSALVEFIPSETTGTAGLTVVTAHELGHTFGLPGVKNNINFNEEYNQDPDTKEVISSRADLVKANGFNVYSGAFKTDKINFMSDASYPSSSYWVSNTTWVKLQENLSLEKDDPKLIYVTFMLTKTDKVYPMHWHTMDGFDSEHDKGVYEIVTIDAGGNDIESYKFDPEFVWEVEGADNIITDKTVISKNILLSDDVRLIEIRKKNVGSIFSVNPEVKILEDYSVEIIEQCNINTYQKSIIESGIHSIVANIINKSFNKKDLIKLREIGTIYASLNSKDCDLSSSYFRTPQEISLSVFEQLDRLNKIFEADYSAHVGDFDKDGDVDQNDLNILMTSRNKPVNEENNSMDLDGDGMITGLDARKLTQICTRARCAFN
ncbi:MAG: hypothetical protein V4629_02240 [Pseudomonadota bacterium]